MQRRELLKRSATLGVLAALPFSYAGCFEAARKETVALPRRPLARPADGSAIPVAFLVSEDTVLIDVAGPWDAFLNVMPGGRMDVPTFHLYTVSESVKPIKIGGGLTVVPEFSFANAPAPKVIVIPAQKDDSNAVLDWIRQASTTADLTMSICTGAFILAKTGLLDGKAATTHHGALTEFANAFPAVHVTRGVRFVEDGNLASSGGLSSGIDLALRVVERYYDYNVAAETATNLEYQSRGWFDPSVNAIYAKAAASQTACVVCGMQVDRATALWSGYKGKTYYFCSADHKRLFDADPAKVLPKVAAT